MPWVDTPLRGSVHGLIAAGLVWLAAGGLAAARQAPQPPRGTGIIAGTVTAGDTGRPLRRARVTLTNSETNAGIGTVATDAEGRFSFANVRAGLFTLRASKAGYLEVIYGQKKLGSGRAGTPIQLLDGQSLDRVALPMPRGGVISGMVTDEAGDPAYNIPVRAMKYVLRNGVRTVTPAGSATTDDRGNYRIAMLAPGEYTVCAAPRDEFVDARVDYDQIHSRLPPERLARIPKPDEPREAYVFVCIPGTTRLSSAATITLDVSEERAGNHVQLQIVPITKISGTVSWSGGQLPIGTSASDTSVWLVDQASLDNPSGQRVAKPGADGRFSFANVTPGQYALVAQAYASPQAPLWANVEVNVAGQQMNDVMLSMALGVPVSGRVVVEGSAPVDLTKLRLTASPAGLTPGEMAALVGSVEADGRFTIPGVVPGKYRIMPYQSGSFGAAIKSSVFGGVDSLDFPIDVRGGEPVTGGVVTVVPRLAEITGPLQNASNQPATGFTVIAFSADNRYWTPQSRRIQAARPASDGRYSLKNLPAGEYRLVAVDDVEPGQWFDPAFLRGLMSVSMSVTLIEGERREQNLRIGR